MRIVATHHVREFDALMSNFRYQRADLDWVNMASSLFAVSAKPITPDIESIEFLSQYPQPRRRRTTLPNRAHQSLSRTWIETVYGSPTPGWIYDLDLSVLEHALTCQVQQGLSRLHALVHLHEGATENRDEAHLPSRTRQREPHSDSQNAYASKSKDWMLGFETLGPTCEDRVRFQLLILPFHLLIHSDRMAWMISFTFLVLSYSIIPQYPPRPVCPVLA